MEAAEDYEAWVAVIAERLGLGRLERTSLRAAYLRVSRQIQELEAPGLRTAARDNEDLAVRALVFGQRTWRILRDLVPESKVRGRRVVDVGAGTGPASLWALRGGASAVRSLEAGTWEARWLQAATAIHPNSDRWRILETDVAADGLEANIGELWVFGFCLRELTRGRVDRSVRRVRRLLEAGARVLILEPGTQDSASHLQRVRDELAPHVRRPCRGALACPRGGEGSDWCHFTWPAQLGPLATAVLQSSGRRANRLHFSYLDLEWEGSSKVAVGGARLLEVDGRGRKHLRLRVCGPGGESSIAVPPRPKRVADWARGLSPGSVLPVESSAFQDGRRGLELVGVPPEEVGPCST